MSGVFWEQSTVERLLRHAVRHGRIARCYLFAGPDGVGKWPAALWLASALLESPDTPRETSRVWTGTHPDWHVLFPVTKDHEREDIEAVWEAKRTDPFAVVRFAKRPYLTIDRVRETIDRLHMTAVEGRAKVVLIGGAEQMAHDTQTILLKSIEEPPPDTYFILSSADPGRLLPTVLSRCQSVRFAPVDPAAVAARLITARGLDPEEAETVAEICGGGWGQALRLCDPSLAQWRADMVSLWKAAFRSKTHELTATIESFFPAGSVKLRLDQALLAFDVWGALLKRECAGGSVKTGSRGQLADAQAAWECWQILQRGRAALYVNVAARMTVVATFLALRRRLGAGEPRVSGQGP